jgi:hypothetical protein
LREIHLELRLVLINLNTMTMSISMVERFTQLVNDILSFQSDFFIFDTLLFLFRAS